MKPRLVLSLLAIFPALVAHPMGDDSVSHYARIETGPRGAHIRYVLHLAEVPASELLARWKLDAASPRDRLDARAAEQARSWAKDLAITVGGRSVSPRVVRTELTIDRPAGGRPLLRIASDLHLAVAPGPLTYEDRNYPDHPGWKEIVIAGRDPDRSRELTVYPEDTAPPRQFSASLEWGASAASATSATEGGSPAPAMRADYLSQLLRRGDLGLGMILAGLAVAFGLGAMHAMSPGHGKTIVAAYLIGSRGTAKHAAFLGGMVTFTHTISVFFLGFVTLFLSQYVLPEKLYPVLGAISGISIVWIGSSLLYRRWLALRGPSHQHDHAHGLVHDHGDGHVHSHVPEGDVTMASLVALGASGGLVPCPSALVLLLSSIALGRVGLGLVLLVAFSAGLAAVLTAIGLVVVYAKSLLPDGRKAAQNPALRLAPVLSAAVIVCVGLIMTGVSIGVIRPERFFAGV